MSARLISLWLVFPLSIGIAFGQATKHPVLDPAAAQIHSLDDALLATMKGAGEAVMVRYRKLAPVVEQVFDLRAMTRIAVGPAWAQFSADEQQAGVTAFTRLTIASYVHNFSTFDREQFEIDPNIVTRGADKVVQTQLLPAHGTPVTLNYRMRQSQGAWKIIDVYYGAVSQLTMRRSDFAAAVATGGASALIDHMNSLSDQLIKP